jgi:hypothetical protein
LFEGRVCVYAPEYLVWFVWWICNFTMLWASGRAQVLALAREKTNKRWKTQRDEGRGGEKSKAGMDR